VGKSGMGYIQSIGILAMFVRHMTLIFVVSITINKIGDALFVLMKDGQFLTV
jgi:hypothetical protein